MGKETKIDKIEAQSEHTVAKRGMLQVLAGGFIAIASIITSRQTGESPTVPIILGTLLALSPKKTQ